MNSTNRVLLIAQDTTSPLAKDLFTAFSSHHSGISPTLLVSRGDAEGQICRHADNEYFWNAGPLPGSSPGWNYDLEIRENLRSFLASVNPDIVHAYVGRDFNYAIIEAVHAFNPHLPIYLTPLDYEPICPKSRFMLSAEGLPCLGEGGHVCRSCFVDSTPAELWLRKRRYLHFFSLATAIITPSNFLQNRFMKWGIEPENLYSIENCVLPFKTGYLPRIKRNYNRYAYFGPVEPVQGLQVVLHALASLPPTVQKNIILEIYSENEIAQPKEFQTEINGLVSRLAYPGNIKWLKMPGMDDISKIIFEMDWLIFPQLWADPSPLALQWARQFHLPVICAGHASLSEKIRHDVDGLQVGGEGGLDGWAQALSQTSGNENLWKKLSEFSLPANPGHAVDEYLRLMGIMDDPWDF